MTVGRALWDLLAGAVWLTCCVRAGLSGLEALEADGVLLWALGAVLAVVFMCNAGQRVFDVLRVESLEKELSLAQTNTKRAICAHEETLGRMTELQVQIGILQEAKSQLQAQVAQPPTPPAPQKAQAQNEAQTQDPATSTRFAMLGRELLQEETKP